MEVGAATTMPATAAADQVVSMLEVLQQRMERLMMKVAKMETRQMQAVSPRPITTRGPKSGELQPPNWNRWVDGGDPSVMTVARQGTCFGSAPNASKLPPRLHHPPSNQGANRGSSTWVSPGDPAGHGWAGSEHPG